MSYTVSRGLVDASHWAGMASAVSAYLEQWAKRDKKRSVLPRGQFGAAKRFFNYVLQGTALENRQRKDSEAPTMAGISNLTIAVEVLAALPWKYATSDEVETRVQSYIDCLNAIEEPMHRNTIDAKTVESLCVFLRELQRQGNLARHAAMATTEFSLM